MLLAGRTAAAATARRTAGALGFRRLECIRLLLDDGGVSAQVCGVLHRYPRSVRVPLALAAKLVEDGIPVVVEDRRHDAGGSR